MVVQTPLGRIGQPRDIARQIAWKARYQAYTPSFDVESASEACRNYYEYAAGALAELPTPKIQGRVPAQRKESPDADFARAEALEVM